MSTEKLRVGVIGTSWWATVSICPACRRGPTWTLWPCAARNTERLEEMAARYNVRQTFTDWRRMVARAGLTCW